MWIIDVQTSDHDAVKAGILAQRTTRYVMSQDAYPDPAIAKMVAAQMAVAIHGGMPTQIFICI